jgi:hypothetical protein
MTIIVEDGTIVTGANSYVSEAELTAFASSRAITLSSNYTTEQLLILAMDYIESLEYKGIKRLHTQPLQWPRVDVYIDGYYNNTENIPKELKNGLMQTAVAISNGYNPLAETIRKTVREKVGDLEVEYASSSSSRTIDKKINAYLYKLISGGNGGNNVIIGKG